MQLSDTFVAASQCIDTVTRNRCVDSFALMCCP